MTKTLLGIDLDVIEFGKRGANNSTKLTLDLILKGNWHPQTRQQLTETQSFICSDEIL